jgi:hypothetical protein
MSIATLETFLGPTIRAAALAFAFDLHSVSEDTPYPRRLTMRSIFVVAMPSVVVRLTQIREDKAIARS